VSKVYVASSWRNIYQPSVVEQLRADGHEVYVFRNSDVGFESDYAAMQWADTCVLVLPCGRSAHAEAGWMAGQGKRTLVYIPEPIEPELMYLMFGQVCLSMSELREALGLVGVP
jgi:hypothetical protein